MNIERPHTPHPVRPLHCLPVRLIAVLKTAEDLPGRHLKIEPESKNLGLRDEHLDPTGLKVIEHPQPLRQWRRSVDVGRLGKHCRHLVLFVVVEAPDQRRFIGPRVHQIADELRLIGLDAFPVAIALGDLPELAAFPNAADGADEQLASHLANCDLLLRRQRYAVDVDVDRRDLLGVVLPAVDRWVRKKDAPVRQVTVEVPHRPRSHLPAVVGLPAIYKVPGEELINRLARTTEDRVVRVLDSVIRCRGASQCQPPFTLPREFNNPRAPSPVVTLEHRRFIDHNSRQPGRVEFLRQCLVIRDAQPAAILQPVLQVGRVDLGNR